MRKIWKTKTVAHIIYNPGLADGHLIFGSDLPTILHYIRRAVHALSDYILCIYVYIYIYMYL